MTSNYKTFYGDLCVNIIDSSTTTKEVLGMLSPGLTQTGLRMYADAPQNNSDFSFLGFIWMVDMNTWYNEQKQCGLGG